MLRFVKDRIRKLAIGWAAIEFITHNQNFQTTESLQTHKNRTTLTKKEALREKKFYHTCNENCSPNNYDLETVKNEISSQKARAVVQSQLWILWDHQLKKYLAARQTIRRLKKGHIEETTHVWRKVEEINPPLRLKASRRTQWKVRHHRKRPIVEGKTQVCLLELYRWAQKVIDKSKILKLRKLVWTSKTPYPLIETTWRQCRRLLFKNRNIDRSKCHRKILSWMHLWCWYGINYRPWTQLF